MKKLYSLNTEASKNDNYDQTRRLYKTIFDGIHYLDSEQVYAKSCCDLFSRLLVTQRMKVREHCERLMFLNPVGYGRKAEELLWRKGYYEPFSIAKQVRAGSNWNLMEKAYLQAHLLSGVGHYQNIILRLQAEFSINLRGVVDFPLLVCDEGLPKRSTTISKKSSKNHSASSVNSGKNGVDDWSGLLDWANQAVYRCLQYLGDLSRYLVDIYPNWDAGLAARYYYQALSMKPDAGMPHNQLGTLSCAKNYNLDAVYHYMRCICAIESFEGTEGNLTSVLERNARTLEVDQSGGDGPLVKRCITQFLFIAGILFFDEAPNEDMAILVDRLLKTVKQCIEEELPKHVMKEPETLDDAVFSVDKQPDHLKDELLFKIFAISLMCIQRCIEKGFDKTGAEALCLSLTSVLVQVCAKKFTENLPPPKRAKPTSNNQKLHSLRRRRRRHNNSLSSDDSDSESERIEIISSDSCESEEELVFDENSSSESDEGNEKIKVNGTITNGECLNGKKEFPEHKKLVNGASHVNGSVKDPKVLHISRVTENKTFKFVKELSQKGLLLQTVKVCCDWLSCNMHILSSCIESSRPLISNFVTLFNYLLQIPLGETALQLYENGFDTKTVEDDKPSTTPLVEDIELRNLSVLKPAHSSINWDHLKTKHMDSDLQTMIRVSQILQFGRKLGEMKDVHVDFNEDRKWFTVETPVTNSTPELQQIQNDGLARGKLMQNLGKAWLRAEVQNLESKTERSTPLPPYLIVDCDALVNYGPFVKQFVNSKKFIVLIPSVVVQMLDELKRSSGKVRDTIRWLEAQLKNGNRFLQAQHSNQRESIPFIKYPKKKDKESWAFFQVLECCHYLSKQTTNDASNLITLVTGTNLNSCNFNPISVAKSAGVNVEHIETFHGKWKNSCKSHG